MMKCYIHDENKEKKEAVAVCIVCGMGLCEEHAQRADLQIWEGKYPMPVKILEKNLPRFICKYCIESIYTVGCE